MFLSCCCISNKFDPNITDIEDSKEQKKEELVSFLGNLSSQQFFKVQQFFATMPRIKKEIEYDCPVCGLHHKKTLEGMQSFF